MSNENNTVNTEAVVTPQQINADADAVLRQEIDQQPLRDDASPADYGWTVEDSEFLFFDDGETQTFKLMSEGHQEKDKYQNDCVVFDISLHSSGEVLKWKVTSKRVLRVLMKMRPLSGKTITVRRTGEGFDTKYTVSERIVKPCEIA